jgi:hypothetical protein
MKALVAHDLSWGANRACHCGQCKSKAPGSLGVKEAAAYLNWTEQALRARIARRQVPFRRLGSRIIFIPRELDQFLAVLEGVSVEQAVERMKGGAA